MELNKFSQMHIGDINLLKFKSRSLLFHECLSLASGGKQFKGTKAYDRFAMLHGYQDLNSIHFYLRRQNKMYHFPSVDIAKATDIYSDIYGIQQIKDACESFNMIWE